MGHILQEMGHRLQEMLKWKSSPFRVLVLLITKDLNVEIPHFSDFFRMETLEPVVQKTD